MTARARKRREYRRRHADVTPNTVTIYIGRHYDSQHLHKRKGKLPTRYH